MCIKFPYVRSCINVIQGISLLAAFLTLRFPPNSLWTICSRHRRLPAKVTVRGIVNLHAIKLNGTSDDITELEILRLRCLDLESDLDAARAQRDNALKTLEKCREEVKLLREAASAAARILTADEPRKRARGNSLD